MSWLARIFRRRTAVEQSRENPVLKEAVRESAQIYDQIPLKKHIDEARRAELARELYLLVNAACNASDPRIHCRERLTESMHELAAYQVLVIPPDPGEDISGLRALPGVSGELTEHLPVLCKRDDFLRGVMYEETESDAFDDLFGIVERKYWEACWRSGTLNAARLALGDRVEGGDWYRPFLHALCVQKEHTYRWQLELPPALPGDSAREAANAYAVFADIVLAGADNPAIEWRDYGISLGIPLPDWSS